MQVIFNADDFGYSTNVNAAVIQAHKHGVLTSASLMVTGNAVDEAIRIAQDTPTLAVGLHIVLLQGRAVLPAGAIPDLVDQNGYFEGHPVKAGVRYFINPKVQKQIQLELEAQFKRFTETELTLSHVNGHLNIHMHPTVLHLLINLAEKYQAHGLRVPRDEFWKSIHYDRRHPGTKLMWAITFYLLVQSSKRKLERQSCTITHRVYGLMQSGQMQDNYVLGLLNSLNVPTAEIYFHPSILETGDPLGPNLRDFQCLLNPKIKELIHQRGIQLATYTDLYEEQGRHD